MPDKEDEITCGAVILAGGRNSRMGGRNKAFLKVGGETILNRVVKRLRLFFDEILLVTRAPALYQASSVEVIEDIFEARSSLTGVHAGLTHARSDYAFVIPCDAPFIRPALIRLMLSELEASPASIDVLVPFHEGRYEPLCAIYSKNCIDPIEEQLKRKDYKIYHFFDQIRLKTLSAERIKSADPEMRSFFNVNTPEAYQRCRELCDPF
ncbi:MAG: molybdenum cofactor guanylyltransferase [Thermodesulfobacteriota bacterium]